MVEHDLHAVCGVSTHLDLVGKSLGQAALDRLLLGQLLYLKLDFLGLE